MSHLSFCHNRYLVKIGGRVIPEMRGLPPPSTYWLTSCSAGASGSDTTPATCPRVAI